MGRNEQEMRKFGKRRIAYHEAGHAVIALVLGVDVPCVSMARIGASAEGTPATLRWSAEWLARNDPRTMLVGLETDAKITLAGPSAEQKYRPDTNIKLALREQWRDDMRLAQSAATKIVLIRADPNQQFDFDGERTFKITAEQNAEIAQLVNRFSDEVRVLVEQHWPAIERVATALLNRRIVYTDEIDAAIAG
jgi:hypothetical protein